ncbi:hypothetical protein G6F17_001261 [Rhizopus arrhizus]|nr:hypothetical protein G6F17_001261 [Rhizopus arrhizus]
MIELTSLLALINAYELASNAKLNLDKTIAVFLSGHSQPLWRRCLQHRGITHWHDSSSHVTAIYLGFPLTSSSAQLTTVLDKTLGSTRLIVHRLAFRRLSIQGRGLIVNTLILSRVSFDTCRRPRKEGGLAVLDPATQPHAFQLRWLRPLAQPDTEPNYKHSFALQALQYCLCSFSGSSSPVLPLAFAELRSPDVQAMGCCKLLFRRFRFREYISVYRLLAVVVAEQTEVNCLQYTLYRLPQPNFEDMLTVELPGTMDFDYITLKLFRTSNLLPIDALPAHYLRGPATAWRKFWLSSFPHQEHTVIWRYYHRKLPTRQRLHQICPDRHLDPFCLLCGGVEDDEHFLWSCEHKKEIWSRIVNRFLQPTARLTYDSLALGSSTDIQVLSGLRVDGHTIIACTVWAIWHFVFDGRTFWPDEAAARATQAIKRIHDENSYRERQKSLRSD